MPKLIKDKVIVDDSWTVLESTDTPESVDTESEQIIVPLNVWQSQKEQLQARKAEIGVWLDSHELADQLGDDAAGLALVAVNFPGFMDGRGFTAARLLRERYGFEGELRAIGGIIRDQLFFLQRCGFNSFAMNESIDLEAALASFGDFSETYQAACDEKLPLFRRRA
ncbi:MAG: oxidoreductase [Cellvibrionaceae bacterium]|nr:oxidoreductase [Cellvibrionaceae bacterium]|tara:strand:- start:94 stop:594 length:501 start_codon:yes stop_codon:yes gene_type:complete